METYNGITGKNSRTISYLFFVIGVIGAIGFRIVLILNKINPIYASISWYVAIIAYLFFYGYRYYIDEKRKLIILKNNLRIKIKEGNIDEQDRKNVSKILDSILVSKAKWNYMVLFVTSVMALIVQIILDLWI
ncbi:MAG: hypothetical protein Q8N88_04665 [Nanoarchaeota archaeon]|nr:hypothetical protein [Nanoarchaeota archaeon]